MTRIMLTKTTLSRGVWKLSSVCAYKNLSAILLILRSKV